MSHQSLPLRRTKRKSLRGARKRSATESQRSLNHETLERRELLAAEILQPAFAPGTTQEQIEQYQQRNADPVNIPQAANIGVNPSRWTQTASGTSPNLGDSTVITWSIVPDGTEVVDLAAGEQSDLIAFLDGIYGNNGAAPNDPVENRPWFELLQRGFDDWEDASGIDFVYEPNDDGVPVDNFLGDAGREGELGVRGDIRISGGDGSAEPGVLAFAFFPTAGDIVFDTQNPFYAANADTTAAGPNLGFHNTLTHEIGHSIGLGHVAPNFANNALLEPNITFAFRGPQHDDILGAHTLYGDRYGDNDTQATAVPLGALGSIDTETNLSIDENADADWFSFDATTGQLLNLTVFPVGEVYDVGVDGGIVSTVNSSLYSDLRFELYDPTGALISNQSNNLIGEPEFLFSLPIVQDGTYTVGVFGDSAIGPASGAVTPTQLYDLNITEGNSGNPNLLAVAANASDLFDLDPQDQVLANVRDRAPTELVLTFGGNDGIDPANLDSAITVEFSESGNFALDSEQVAIGFIGLDDSQRIATLRFAENLADGFYQLSITSELQSTSLLPFAPNFPQPVEGDPTLEREVISFEIELGAKVISVVPQPIDTNGTARLDQIDVYFDDDDLFRNGSTIADPTFYQLVDTGNTVTTEDDVIVNPIAGGVAVDPINRKVTLTFAANLDNFVADQGDSLRLRIGEGTDFSALDVTPHNVFADPGFTTATANTLPVASSGSWSISLSEEIRNVGLPLQVDNPGSTNEPGHRDIEIVDHLGVPRSRDADNAIRTISYTFLRNAPYGFNSQGDPLFNDINAAQEQRYLEILDIYADLLGVQFFEDDAAGGLRLLVGDFAAVAPGFVSGPGGVAGLGAPGLSILDTADFSNPANDVFGGGFFEVAFHEVGHALGLSHAYDLPPGTVLGDRLGNGLPYPDTVRTVNEPRVEPVFPGDNDIVHGLLLMQNESRDVDLYQIDVAETGVLEINAIAKRLPNSSLLDTSLTLYREEGGSLELVASNNDYFGTDSFIQYDVDAGATYYIGVASDGNTSFNPNSGVPAPGGTTEGVYDLRVDFTSEATGAMIDADGSLLDGDRDGEAGGIYDFWFEPTAPNTIFVNKEAGDGVSTLGSQANPFTNIPAALAAAEALTASGTDGVVVRLLPNGGADGDVTTPGDNIAYEIGIISSLNQTLADGRNLNLPGGIQLVVDAGVIMKFLDSRISVGSDDDGFDRSESTISVQGTPELPVYFTSFNDRTLGANSNILNLPVSAGDWGGIEIRNDVDREQGRLDVERLGIFQNYINHAQISYGGGEVSTINRVIDPVHLSQARAEISYNTITLSSDAAVSADPNTFEVTTFTEPRFQSESVSGNGFVADYERVGPSIFGNTLVNNSTNGIFVRIDTPPGGGLETLQVTARFDDTDIVHALNENLIIQGAAGGGVQQSTRPAPIIGLTPVAGGNLAAGNYQYSYTFVDAAGNETPGSVQQDVFGVSANSQIELTNIPAATGDFVGRRLYRSVGGGSFELVAQLDRTSPDFTDNLATPSTSAAVLDPSVGSVRHGNVAGSLVLDPGTILKSQGARIELGFGANLIAEGVAGNEVILTSRNDDEFGAGGTFDTNGDGDATTEAAGDWGGIYASPTSALSIDRALLAYAGGITGAGGGTAAFNAIQIHQADARIANSVLRDNASGLGGGQLNSRSDFVRNSAATIHVTGTQPTIVGNTFLDNAGATIDINVNALNATFNRDLGRQTGDIDTFDIPPANTGPVIRGNQTAGNGVNGLVVRGEVLTTEVVWDDTDIVHVLRNDIEIPDFHTYGGLRLESSATESLVVKFDNAEILATGRPLDITDRIGGRLHVLGQPGFPVILTSINDDTVGASFAPDGSVQTQTLSSNTPNTPAPGDWQGLKFDEFSHDQNISVVIENEGEIGGFGDLNATIGSQQDLGILAPNAESGDETIRLGYTVHGAIADNNDQDLYSFEGFGGTLVWIDIDETDPQLDTVLEILDGNGRVLALSQDSRTESNNGELTYTDTGIIRDGHALPMRLDHNAPTNATGEYRDLYTTNDGDSGLRIVLPGTTGTQQTFFVRVRSNNAAFDLTTEAGIDASLDTGGLTQGGYRVQIRLQEVDQFAGSVVRYADIRYATTAIDVVGLPIHSTIAGEVASNPGGTVNIGSFANTDQGAVSISGNSSTTDTFQFSTGRDGLQPPLPGVPPTTNAQSLVFDVDYSDGLTRPDTNLYLFDGNNNLIAIGTDSNIADDRITPFIPGLPATTQDDLSRGSQGARDPFIGPLELLPNINYQVVVANNSLMAPDLQQFTLSNPANPNARLEPIDSAIRVTDDRFDIPNDSPTGNPFQTPAALQVGFQDDGSGNIIPWQFGDLPLIVFGRQGSAGDNSQLNIFNPFTGRHDAIIDRGTDAIGAAAQSPRNVTLAIERPTVPNLTDNNTNTVYSIDSNGTLTDIGTTEIVTYENFDNGDADPTTNSNRVSLDGDGVEFRSLAYYNDTISETSFLYGLADRTEFRGSQVIANAGGADIIGGFAGDINADNLIYLLDPDTGQAVSRNQTEMRAGFQSASPLDPRLQNDANFNIPLEAPWAGTDVIAQIQVPTTAGIVNSLVTDINGGQSLLAFTDQGAVWSFDINADGDGADYSPGDLQVDTVPTFASPTGFRVSDTELLLNPSVATPFGTLPGIYDSQGTLLIFDEVTKGPANYTDVNDTIGISDLYFGIQSGTDRLFAFRLDAFDGVNVAEPVFEFGAESIQLDTANAGAGYAGFFFSPLDQTLWHNSNTSNNIPGHGLGALQDRGNVGGGASLRFGFDSLDTDFNHVSDVPVNSLAASDLQNFSGYNFLGGAHGTVQSNALDLSGFSSDDLPTLYFTYLLDTENVNTNLGDASVSARDTLRVYVSGSDGQWALVATNNVVGNIAGRNFNSTIDEFGPDVSGYTDLSTQVFVQELFDGEGFRQARIDLGPWAGDEDVTIRYEFSTAGETRPDQTEIYAVDADQILDGDTIELSGEMPDALTSIQGDVLLDRTEVFEFDLGLVVRLPAGQDVGAPLTLAGPGGTVVELISSGTPTGNQVLVLDTDSAEDVADRVAARFGPSVVRSSDHPDWVGFTNVTAVGTYTFGDPNDGFILSQPGVDLLSTAIEIELDMTANEVQAQIHDAIVNQIHYADLGPNPAAFPLIDGTSGIRIYDLTVRQTALPIIAGELTAPVGSNDILPASELGVFNGGVSSVEDLLRAGQRSIGVGGNNGVYIDDIVIGLAERGESVTNSTAGSGLVANPYFPSSEVTSGAYQLEVRLGREYLGVDNTGKLEVIDPFAPPIDNRVGGIGVGVAGTEGWRLNERLAGAFNALVESSGAQLVDGDSFELSNGFETIRFEFNDTTLSNTPVASTSVAIDYVTSDTVGEVADLIRNAINSPSVRAILGIEATSSGGLLNDPTDRMIFFHGYAAATATGSSTFGSPHLRGIVSGTDFLLGEDNGDRNSVRNQGQFIIDSNVISFSADTAIDIRAGDTGPGNKAPNEGDRPKPGVPQSLPTLQSGAGTLHGAVVQNNLLISNGTGISLSGNPAQGGPDVFTRIVNNTVFGSTGTGIAIANRAAPTLINNVVANNDVGISAVNEGPTVIRGTVFDNNDDSNTTGIGMGTEAIVDPVGDLFVNPNIGIFDPFAGSPNFYPAAGSALIDIGIGSQPDRPNLVAVKDSVGIPESPIVVTEVDLAGQIRRDGSTAAGQGGNVNIDIGALDRSDTTGPEAIIIVPTDNDALNADIDREDTFLQLTDGIFSFFEILISDGTGIGPDSSTITPNQLTILENGRQLFPGLDVVIGYNASNRTLRFSPPSGTWRNDAVYEIILQNQPATLANGVVVEGVSDLAGNLLQPNRADGQTRFTIVMPGVELDLGDAPDSYGTAFGDNGARHAIIDFGSPRLGRFVDGETDSAGVGSDDVPSVVTAQGNVGEASSGPFAITTVGGVTTVDLTALPSLNDNLQITASGRLAVFELVPQGGTATVGRIPVEFAPSDTLADITTSLADAVANALPSQNLLATVTQSGATQFELRGADDEDGASIGQVTIGSTTIDGVFTDPATNEVLSYLNPLSPDGAELVVSTIGGGILDLWIDFNNDGDFLDANERVVVGQPVLDGENRLQISTPSDISFLSNSVNGTGTTFARFRLSDAGNPSPIGLVVGGEVEDYNVFIARAALPEPDDDQFGRADGLFEDNPFTLTAANAVGANDVLSGAAGVEYVLESDVSNGTLVFNPDGSFSYDPATDFFGTDTFTYRITGTQDVEVGGVLVALPVRSSRAATVTLTIEAENDPPTALSQSVVTTEPSDTNTLTAITLTSAQLLTGATPHVDVASLPSPFNESEQALKVSQVSVFDSTGVLTPLVDASQLLDPTTPIDGTYTAPTHVADGTGFVQSGTVSITVLNGGVESVTYQPAEDYNRDNPDAGGFPSFDQFVFTVADDGATTLADGNPAVPQPLPQTVDATVTILVQPQNDPPTAANDVIDSSTFGVALQEDTPFTIPTAFLLSNDFAGTQADDDESLGINDTAVSLVTAQGATNTTLIGAVNSGIAVDDTATGTGYILFSELNVFTRFAAAPPVNLPGVINSSNLVAARFNGFTWEYNNDSNWIPFTPDPTDRLIAAVNFDFDTIDSLLYATGTVSGIQQGFVASDLTFESNQFGGQPDLGEFLVSGTFFDTSADPEFPTEFRAFPLTTNRGGTVSLDSATGDLVYTPPLDYFGPDSFEYLIVDQGVNVAVDGTSVVQNKFDIATATLTIDPVNDAPAANDQGFVTLEDTPITITADMLRTGSVGHANPVLPFPFDESNQDATTTVTALNIGAETVTAANAANGPFPTTNGTIDAVNFDTNDNLIDFQYTPNPDFNADNPRTGGGRTIDQFSYTLTDDGIAQLPTGGTFTNPPESVQALVSIFVTPQNDDPVASDDLITSTSSIWNSFSSINPVEDSALVIPAAFLLSNDTNAPTSAGDELGGINDTSNLTIVNTVFTTALGGTVTLLPNGDLLYEAPADRFGLDTFEYQVADQGVDEDVNGTRQLSPRPDTATVSILIEPINDAPRAFDRSFGGVEDTLVSFTAADLLGGANPAIAIDASTLPPAPFVENEQSLRVVAFSDGDESIDVNDLFDPSIGLNGTGTLTLNTVSGGLLTFNFSSGAFVDGTYLPGQDYNQRTPFAAVELFDYVVADDGVTTLVGSGDVDDTGVDTVLDLPDQRSAPATVELTVTSVNDPPSFQFQSVVDILERDDSLATSISDFATNVFPGPATALDELQRESVVFTYLPDQSTVQPGLFLQAPSVSSSGVLSVHPSPDVIGSATIVMRVEDLDNLTPGFVPQTQLITFTVNVRPVNDAPQIRSSVLNTSDSASPDAAYSVAGNGEVTYTLTEDNTDSNGVASPYLIPLSAPTGAGFAPIGLLDLFEVGPSNEVSAADGGSQVLELFNFPTQTDLGGTLVAVTDGSGDVIGLEYTPPADYNNTQGVSDSFNYLVNDVSTTGGETFSLFSGQLEPDPLTASNRVRLNLTPVNDAPIYQLSTNNVQAAEDAGLQSVAGFAFNFAAGPATATDEIEFALGQNIDFELSPVNITAADLPTSFTTEPTISAAGVLQYESAPDVFGQFVFEVSLVDDGLGADVSTRGDINRSNIETLTIDIRPVNDPPAIDPAAGSLAFNNSENTTLFISANGSIVSGDLLGAFTVGPANEASTADPGGNQSLALGVVPLTTVSGGTLTAVQDAAGNLTGYDYQPPVNFVGQDSFVYQLQDDGETVLVASNGQPTADPRTTDVTVTINVVGVNDPPIFTGAADVIVLEDEGVVTIPDWATSVLPGPLGALDEVSGATAQTVTASLTSLSNSSSLFATQPTVTLVGTTLSLSFETAQDQSGVADFQLVLTDNGPAIAANGDVNQTVHPFQIVIGVENDPPTFTASPTPVLVDEDSGLFTLSNWATNISPGPGDEAATQTIDRFEVEVPAGRENLFAVLPNVSVTGELTFTPAPDANGTVDVLVTAVDSVAGRSLPATLTITINPVDDSPIAVDDTVLANEDELLRIDPADLLANDFDPDSAFDPNEVLSVVISTPLVSDLGATITRDSNGDLIYDPTTSTILQALPPNTSLVDQFTYMITDTDGEDPMPTANVLLNVQGINDEPTAVADSVFAAPNVGLDIDVLANDFDVDGSIDPASIIITLQPENGSLIVNNSGTVTYVSDVGFTGPDEFSYTVGDDLGQQSEPATVTVDVGDLPTANPDVASGVSVAGQLDVDVLANDEGDFLASTLVIETQPTNGTVTILPNGQLRYVPTAPFTGQDSFTYSVEDSSGRRSLPGTVTLNFVVGGRQNQVDNFDVDASGLVTPLDAILVINMIADEGLFIPIPDDDFGPLFWDVDGSQAITAVDAILVINFIADRSDIFGEQVDAPIQPIGSDTIELGTNLNRNGDQFEPAMSISDSTDQVITTSSVAQQADFSVIDLIAGDDEETDEQDEIAAVDAVLSDLF